MDHRLFEITVAGVVRVKNVINVIDDIIAIDDVATAKLLAEVNKRDGPTTFTFDVNIFVDTNTGDGCNGGSLTGDEDDPEEDDRDRDGFVQPELMLRMITTMTLTK